MHRVPAAVNWQTKENRWMRQADINIKQGLKEAKFKQWGKGSVNRPAKPKPSKVTLGGMWPTGKV